jgi:hypothetical protein
MYQYEVLMAKQERRAPLPRIVDFEADAFDLATDNRASKTCTLFFTDLYEVKSVDNATLTAGVGMGEVTSCGQGQVHLSGQRFKKVIVNDYGVVGVCPSLSPRILSVPNCSLWSPRAAPAVGLLPVHVPRGRQGDSRITISLLFYFI